MSSLKELRDVRLDKLNRLRALGVNPYTAKSFKDTENGDILVNFEKVEGKEVTVAGRAVAIRTHGKLAFIDIRDQSGKIQLYIKEDNITKADHINEEINFSELDLLDNGDFVEGTGKVVKTQRGEISVEVSRIRLLTKSLRPLPDSWEGLKDKETRLRRRYLDLATNPEIFERFMRKAKFWEANREFMRKHGFIEIETPVLENATGGADATPFVTHHNYLDQDFFLRISTELYQKRLIGGGFEKIFTLGPNFRNEGLSDEHHQEYSQIEWYWAYADYRDNMNFVKDMMRYVSQEVYGKTEFTTRGHTFDLANEWTEVDYPQILKEQYGLDIFNTNLEELKKMAKDHNVKIDANSNEMRIIDALWKDIRKTLSGPAFLINEPAFMSPLAKSRREDTRLTERFHIILAGSELGNGYSELNDPQDQLARFMDQQDARENGDTEAQMLDIDYVEMLEYGMPPCSGYAHSERLFWFLEDVPSREGVLFPQMRHDVDDVTKGIYPKVFKSTEQKNAAHAAKPQDFDRKAVIVIDEALENWQITNTIAHTSAFIGHKLNERFGTGENFVTEDKITHPRNSQYPFITLKASKAQLSILMSKVRDSKLLYHGFIQEMIRTTDDKEITTILKNKKDTEIEYLGIGIFGTKEEVNSLTKKFSLYK